MVYRNIKKQKKTYFFLQIEDFDFSMSRDNAYYHIYKNAPIMCGYMKRRTCFGFGEWDKNKEKMKQATHWYSEGIGRICSLWYDLWDRSREWWGSFGLAWNKGGKVSWNKEYEEGFIMSAKIVVDKILSVIFKSVWWQLSSQSIKMDLRKPIWKSWSIHSITIFTEYSLTRYYLEVANI